MYDNYGWCTRLTQKIIGMQTKKIFEFEGFSCEALAKLVCEGHRSDFSTYLRKCGRFPIETVPQSEYQNKALLSYTHVLGKEKLLVLAIVSCTSMMKRAPKVQKLEASKGWCASKKLWIGKLI